MKSKQQWVALGAAAAVLAIAACGGHGGGGAVPGSPNVAATPYNGPAALAAFTWGREQLFGAAYEGPAGAGSMQVYVQVKQQDAQGLLQYAQEASDPHSALYRRFLTPQEIGDRFGASRQDYQAAANYFVSQGLSVAGWPQRLMLSVSGSQAAMERAFGTRFGTYEKDGVQFTAPVGTPHFSKVLPVTEVANLVTMQRMRRYFLVAPPRANANYEAGYSPQQIQNALDYSGAYAKGYDGSGITVGVIGTGPINVPHVATTYSPWCGDSDLAQLKGLYHVSAATVCEVNVSAQSVAAGLQAPPSPIPTAAPASPNPNTTPVPNTNFFPFSGNFATPPPLTASGCSDPVTSQSTPRYPNCNPEDLEAQLDTQTIATLAPGAAVDFILAYNTNDCFVYFPNSCSPAPPTPAPSASPTTAPAVGPNAGYPAEGIVEYDPEIEQAIAANTVDVLSLSFGAGESDYIGGGYNASGAGFEPEEFAALATEGIAVFVSSGDSGVLECASTNAPCPDWPGTDQNVTSVGGVNLPLNEFGQLTGNITAWGNTNGGNGQASGTWGGSGGGTSSLFAAPSWQHNDVASHPTMREEPDIALDADPFTGTTVFTSAGGCGATTLTPVECPVGGTSLAAPEAAAMWALVLEACKLTPACNTAPYAHTYRLGNAAPYFYGIYAQKTAGSPPVALPYPQVFYDVVYGENAYPGSTGKIVTGATAAPGYDLVTGIGVPFAGHLIQAVTGQPVP